MSLFKPRFISFDGYGALINFQMSAAARVLFADRIARRDMDQFVRDFAAFRLDEVLGAWKPYRDMIEAAVVRLTKLWGVDLLDGDAAALYAAIPSWEPHGDALGALRKLAQRFPLVILANAADKHMAASVERLAVPFHAVFTSDGAKAYKPRLRAFKFMLEALDCGPEEILHVSTSFRYDHMAAHDLGVRHKVFLSRGEEPAAPGYGCVEMPDLTALPAALGL